MFALMKKFKKAVFVKFICSYIDFVYKTSRVDVFGDFHLLDKDYEEKFIIAFWHGDNYCYYPLLKNRNICILTTESKRGDYITGIGEYFGYKPIRAPDESDGKNHLFKIRTLVNSEGGHSIGIALDGPAGPYHLPKRLVLLTAVACKMRIVPIAITVKRKISANHRWDKYTLPLPFNKIEFYVKTPVEVRKNKSAEAAEEIIAAMEQKQK